MVNSITHIHIETSWRTEKSFVLAGPAPIAVTCGLILGIGLGFHNHAPQQAAILLTLHQQATDEIRGDKLGRTGEKTLGERWKGDYIYGSTELVFLRYARVP